MIRAACFLLFVFFFEASLRQDVTAGAFLITGQRSRLAGSAAHADEDFHPLPASGAFHLRQSGGVFSFVATVQQHSCPPHSFFTRIAKGRWIVKASFAQVLLPQAVEIAVGVDCQGLFIVQQEPDLGGLTGLQELSLGASVGDQLDPLDPVDAFHGMIHRAHVHFHDALLHGHMGHVLFLAGIHGVGDQLVHFVAAAVQGDVGIVNHLNDIAAVRTDIELGIFHRISLRFSVVFSYGPIVSENAGTFRDFFTNAKGA